MNFKMSEAIRIKTLADCYRKMNEDDKYIVDQILERVSERESRISSLEKELEVFKD